MSAFVHLHRLADIDAIDIAGALGSAALFQGFVERFALLSRRGPLDLAALMKLVRGYCGAVTWANGPTMVELRVHEAGGAAMCFLAGERVSAVLALGHPFEVVVAALMRDSESTRPLRVSWDPVCVKFEAATREEFRSQAPTVEMEVFVPESERPTVRPSRPVSDDEPPETVRFVTR